MTAHVPTLVAPADWTFAEVVAAATVSGDYAWTPDGWHWLGSAVGPAAGELAADEGRWLDVAQAVNRGDHDRAGTRSAVEALLIGLRGIRHPECQRAAERLRGIMK